MLRAAAIAGLWIGLAPAAVPALADGSPRRVILMIADGAGYTAWQATAMYQGPTAGDLFDSPDWVNLPVSTHPLRSFREVPVGAGHGLTPWPSVAYDPRRAWDATPVDGASRGRPYHFAGYQWLLQASDSANTATTLVTGVKTYPGAINVDGNGESIRETLAWLAHDAGMRVGTVTSVTFNHATPAAAGGAHQASRSAYCELAWEMLSSPLLDVIAGAGHPDFDNNGEPIEDPARKGYRSVGDKPIWDALTGVRSLEPGDGVCAPEGAAEGSPGGANDVSLPTASREQIDSLGRWTLRQRREEIEKLATGPTPQRLLMLPEVGRIGFDGGRSTPDEPYSVKIGGTLQQQRGSRADPQVLAPYDDPTIRGVPGLDQLTLAALNALDDDPDGFFLHVEGGAVDWAMHANQTGRMIEEMIEFKRAVRSVVDWIDARDAWADTLLVVTADHDHLLWGPESNSIPFQPLQDRGQGKLPGHRWLSNRHSNSLVPAMVRGRGATALPARGRGEDPFRGRYIDQTDLFRAMREALLPGQRPEG